MQQSKEAIHTEGETGARGRVSERKSGTMDAAHTGNGIPAARRR